MDAWIVTAKKQTTTTTSTSLVGSHFHLGSTAQPKLFVISRILTAKCL